MILSCSNRSILTARRPRADAAAACATRWTAHAAAGSPMHSSWPQIHASGTQCLGGCSGRRSRESAAQVTDAAHPRLSKTTARGGRQLYLCCATCQTVVTQHGSHTLAPASALHVPHSTRDAYVRSRCSVVCQQSGWLSYAFPGGINSRFYSPVSPPAGEGGAAGGAGRRASHVLDALVAPRSWRWRCR